MMRLKLYYSFLISILIFIFFIGLYEVDGPSMKPTLHDKQGILTFNHYYMINKIRAGDIVIVQKKNEKLIKRIIGLPGDKVEMNRGVLKINGKVKTSQVELSMNEYFEQLTDDIGYSILNVTLNEVDDNFSPINVPSGYVFILGDNRQDSMDSRNFGSVPIERILHKVIPNTNFLHKLVYFEISSFTKIVKTKFGFSE